MLIVADENIPLLDAFFSAFGEVRRYPGRDISREHLLDADVLLVRSVTLVDRTLLEDTRVRFVGTCTIGTDHLDQTYLNQAGIVWSNAPGCNARGVVDYVLGSLLSLAEVTGKSLSERCYGVIGAGQVGARLVNVLKGLGWAVKVCDPPRQACEGGDFVSLQEILQSCDVVSLHTPLDSQTRHLFGLSQLQQLAAGSWLINASRGAVVDNAALKVFLQAGADVQVVLDVWEGEPLADPDLAQLCHIATPHIAGYSLEGKLRGTAQIYQAFCRAQGVEPSVELEDWLPANWLQCIELDLNCPPEWALARMCRAVYDPRADAAAFRRSLQGSAEQRRMSFDWLRKEYPPRREIDGLTVALTAASSALYQVVEALGCKVRH